MTARGWFITWSLVILSLVLVWNICWWPRTLARSVSPDGRYVCTVLDEGNRFLGQPRVVGTLSTNAWWPKEIARSEDRLQRDSACYYEYRIEWPDRHDLNNFALIKCFVNSSSSKPDEQVIVGKFTVVY